jgi:conjugative transfer signal peptidase TraF
VSAGVTIAAALLCSDLIFNRTQSLPLGLYGVRDATIRRDDVIAFPIPESIRELVTTRHYLPPGAVLLKQVVALPGDQVCTNDGIFRAGGEVIGSVLERDSLNRVLPRHQVCGRVPEGKVYVASRHPRSFDSRYFGPVDIQDIRGRAIPLWTY